MGARIVEDRVRLGTSLHFPYLGQCAEVEDGGRIGPAIACKASLQIRREGHPVNALSVLDFAHHLLRIDVENGDMIATGDVQTATFALEGQVLPSPLPPQPAGPDPAHTRLPPAPSGR